jgi:hypothetical protein
MRKFLRISALAALALGATALTAQAQGKATELTAGVFALGSTSCDGCDAVFSLATGGSYIAAGFYLSPSIAIEPTLSVSLLSSDGESVTAFGIGAAIPYYFRKNWGRSGPYLAPRITYTSFSCTDCDGASQLGVGLALGTKLPLNDLAALRMQAEFNYGFENDDFLATTNFGASFGLSVFLP